MGRFFDAFRIDHVLGWYRIWEIPAECVKGNGRLGRFHPAQPIKFENINKEQGLWDKKRLCEPWNPIEVIGRIVDKSDIDLLMELDLVKIENGFIILNKTEFDADVYLKE